MSSSSRSSADKAEDDDPCSLRLWAARARTAPRKACKHSASGVRSSSTVSILSTRLRSVFTSELLSPVASVIGSGQDRDMSTWKRALSSVALMVTILAAVIIAPNATASAGTASSSTPTATVHQEYSTLGQGLAPVPAAGWGDVLRVAGSYLECEAIRATMGALRFITMCVPGAGRSYLLVFI